MYSIINLRDALSNQSTAKENGRAAGEGVWSNYVKGTCWHTMPQNAEEFDACHKELMEELEALRELTKAEKNSLTVAKCVVKKAIISKKMVFRVTEDGIIERDAEGEPLVRGKSELADDVSDFEKTMKALEGMAKRFANPEFDMFTAAQWTEFHTKIEEMIKTTASMADSVGSV